MRLTLGWDEDSEVPIRMDYYWTLWLPSLNEKMYQTLSKIMKFLKINIRPSGHLMQKANSLEKIVMLGKMEDKRRRGQKRRRWLDSITNSTDMNLSKLWEVREEKESLVCCSPQGHRESDTTQQYNKNKINFSFNKLKEQKPHNLISFYQRFV